MKIPVEFRVTKFAGNFKKIGEDDGDNFETNTAILSIVIEIFLFKPEKIHVNSEKYLLNEF